MTPSEERLAGAIADTWHELVEFAGPDVWPFIRRLEQLYGEALGDAEERGAAGLIEPPPASEERRN